MSVFPGLCKKNLTKHGSVVCRVKKTLENRDHMLVSNWHTLCVMKAEKDKLKYRPQVESKQDELGKGCITTGANKQKFAVTNFFNGDT
jgi:hypothetical protein